MGSSRSGVYRLCISPPARTRRFPVLVMLRARNISRHTHRVCPRWRGDAPVSRGRGSCPTAGDAAGQRGRKGAEAPSWGRFGLLQVP